MIAPCLTFCKLGSSSAGDARAILRLCTLPSRRHRAPGLVKRLGGELKPGDKTDSFLPEGWVSFTGHSCSAG